MIFELEIYTLPMSVDNPRPTRVIAANSSLYPFRSRPILEIIKRDNKAEPILDPDHEYLARTNVFWLSTEVEFTIDQDSSELQASKVSHPRSSRGAS